MTQTTLEEIKDNNYEFFRNSPIIVIQEMSDGTFTLHRWSKESVFPTHEYKTAREAVSRILQLLSIGPVAPQIRTEETCIGEVHVES